MAHPSKRKSLFPGGSAFQQALEIPQNRSLRPSPELPPSRSTGRHDPPLIESSRRHPQNAKGREDYRQRKQELIPVKKESPWNTYTDKYGLRLGEWVKVAGKKPSTGEIFAVRSISKSNTEKGLCQIRKLCHENLLTVHEIFDFDSSFYIVSERMHITLDDVIASPAYPEEAELASIIWQVRIVRAMKESKLSTKKPTSYLPVLLSSYHKIWYTGRSLVPAYLQTKMEMSKLVCSSIRVYVTFC